MKFLDMEWYWWLLILAGAAVIIPAKVKFMKWWSRKQKEHKDSRITGDTVMECSNEAVPQ